LFPSGKTFHVGFQAPSAKQFPSVANRQEIFELSLLAIKQSQHVTFFPDSDEPSGNTQTGPDGLAIGFTVSYIKEN